MLMLERLSGRKDSTDLGSGCEHWRDSFIFLINLKDKPAREKQEDYSSDESNPDGGELQHQTNKKSDEESDAANQKQLAAKDNDTKKER